MLWNYLKTTALILHHQGYELTHLHPNSRSGIKGQTSSPSISALPREEGKAEDPCRLENGRGTSTENNDDLLVPFSQVSLAGHLGSINNPITIDWSALHSPFRCCTEKSYYFCISIIKFSHSQFEEHQRVGRLCDIALHKYSRHPDALVLLILSFMSAK